MIFRKKLLTGILLAGAFFGLTACSSPTDSTSTPGSTIPQSTVPAPSVPQSTAPAAPSSTTPSTPVSTPAPSVPQSTAVTTPATTTPEPSVPKLPADATIYLAGDSTVKTYNNDQYIGGWGQFLDLYLNQDVKVVNCAQGGRSARSFINEGRLWDIDDPNFTYSFSENNGNSIEDVIKEGDYLFIQFGHNDDATKMASSYSTIYDRMVPVGTAVNDIYPVTEGTKVSTSALPTAYTDLATDAEEKSALSTIAKYGSEYYSYDCGGTFKWFLKQYVDFAREKGAIPVLVTPVSRVKFAGNNIQWAAGAHGAKGEYVESVRQLAEEEDCLLIDLYQESKTMLEKATPSYSDFLMALKPNDLTGTWPSGYDAAYDNSELGYTGIEATHYNKYGAYLQAAKVAEAILTDDSKHNDSKEYFGFVENVLTTPESFIDPSNLMSKAKVEAIEKLFEVVEVTNPDRKYPDPSLVVAAIEALDQMGEMTNDNYLEFQAKCAELRLAYNSLNVDDRSNVTNLNKLDEYEAKVLVFVEANRPVPVKVVTLSADDPTDSSIISTKVYGDFTIVGSTSKKVTVDSSASSFKYNGVDYSTTKRINMGGSAKFGQYRYISFTVDGPCTITLAAKSSGSDARTAALADSSNTSIGLFDAKSSLSVTSIEVNEGGTYSIGSTGSSIYIYYIIIEYFE